jgi:hypothetical protein
VISGKRLFPEQSEIDAACRFPVSMPLKVILSYIGHTHTIIDLLKNLLLLLSHLSTWWRRDSLCMDQLNINEF